MSQVQQTNQTIPQQLLPGQVERKPATELGKDQFLALLVAQMKNMDPMEPATDKEFIGQMAQFSSLEQTTNLAQSMTVLAFSTQISQGVGLIGRSVSYATDPDSAPETGTVSGVKVVESGEVVVTIDGKDVPTSAIRSVS